MDKSKRLAFFTVLFIGVAALIMYAYAAEPPKVASDDCDDHDHAQASVLEGELSALDPAKAKSLKVQLEELSNEDCANQIASDLAALGNIGKIKCDLTTRQFELEYNSELLTEAAIMQAFQKSGHGGKIISGS